MNQEPVGWRFYSIFLGRMRQVEMGPFPDQLLLLSTLYNTPLLRCSWQKIAASAKIFEGEKVYSMNLVCLRVYLLTGDLTPKWGAPVAVLLSLPLESERHKVSKNFQYTESINTLQWNHARCPKDHQGRIVLSIWYWLLRILGVQQFLVYINTRISL